MTKKYLNKLKQIQVGSRSVALRRVFDLKLRGIHLTKIILKVWVINGQNVVDVSICEVELRCCAPLLADIFLYSYEVHKVLALGR